MSRLAVTCDRFTPLLEAARNGSSRALGELLEACRPYLLLVANENIDPTIGAKVGGSDLVQETFLKSQGAFQQFQGTTEAELLGWLRTTLLNSLANVRRTYHDTDKRDVGREVSLVVPANGTAPVRDPADSAETPSAVMMAREDVDALQGAMQQLSADHRQVIQLRHREQLSFEEVGQRMQRSADAARKLWGRAIEELKQRLGSA